jgi:hypothetical protein
MPRTLQAIKIRELGEALVAAGYVTLNAQAEALGLCRSTTWTIMQATHKNSGLSATVINRMLASPRLPSPVREKLIEYVQEKIAGRYGHGAAQSHEFAGRLTLNVVPFPGARRRAGGDGAVSAVRGQPFRPGAAVRADAPVRKYGHYDGC